MSTEKSHEQSSTSVWHPASILRRSRSPPLPSPPRAKLAGRHVAPRPGGGGASSPPRLRALPTHHTTVLRISGAPPFWGPAQTHSDLLFPRQTGSARTSSGLGDPGRVKKRGQSQTRGRETLYLARRLALSVGFFLEQTGGGLVALVRTNGRVITFAALSPCAVLLNRQRTPVFREFSAARLDLQFVGPRE